MTAFRIADIDGEGIGGPRGIAALEPGPGLVQSPVARRPGVVLEALRYSFFEGLLDRPIGLQQSHCRRALETLVRVIEQPPIGKGARVDARRLLLDRLTRPVPEVDNEGLHGLGPKSGMSTHIRPDGMIEDHVIDFIGTQEGQGLLPYALLRGRPHRALRLLAGYGVAADYRHLRIVIPRGIPAFLGLQVDELTFLYEPTLPYIRLVRAVTALKSVLEKQCRSLTRQRVDLDVNEVLIGRRPDELALGILH